VQRSGLLIGWTGGLKKENGLSGWKGAGVNESRERERARGGGEGLGLAVDSPGSRLFKTAVFTREKAGR